MKTIYNITLNTKSWEDFIQEIELVNFDYIVDIRLEPFSRKLPHFNKLWIKNQFWNKYMFMWETLGWIEDENISYAQFHFWISKLLKLAKDHVVVFFCSKRWERYYKIISELKIGWFKVVYL